MDNYFHDKSEEETKTSGKIDLDVKRVSLHLEIAYNPKPR